MRVFLLAIFTVVLGCSCSTNRYLEKYASVANSSEYVFNTNAPILMELVNDHTYQDILNQGYMLIGTSLFYSPWEARTKAIECAKLYGAEIILFSYTQGESETRAITRYVETAQTSYYQGVAYGPHWRPVPYAGAVTTYTSVPVTRNYVVNFYQQNCYFLAKRRYINSYGVYFVTPQNTPTQQAQQIIIEAVTPNSPADKAGLKPGYVVKTINGKTITNSRDIIPYINNQQTIESLEVVYE